MCGLKKIFIVVCIEMDIRKLWNSLANIVNEVKPSTGAWMNVFRIKTSTQASQNLAKNPLRYLTYMFDETYFAYVLCNESQVRSWNSCK